MNISAKNINILQNYFKTKPVFKAYIFGSFARGEADLDSDYDILVELDYSKKNWIGIYSDANRVS